MSEHTMQTFGCHVLQFAKTVDILPRGIYTDVMKAIEDYLKKELSAGFFSITTEARSAHGEIALLGEWPDPKMPWWNDPIKRDGKYTCQTAIAHDIRKSLWIVGKNGEKLNTTTNYEDLLKNVPPPDIPQYALIGDNDNNRTSIILPLKEGDRHFGVMNVESTRRLEYMEFWEKELRSIADAISILRQLKNTYKLQIDNTRGVVRHLTPEKFVPVCEENKMFFAFSSRADQEVVGAINDALSKYEESKRFRVVKWTELAGGNIIENIWKQISTCAFATCYFSEPSEQQGSHGFHDNPNVLYEAGMLYALQRVRRGPLRGVLLVRESGSKTPFDLSTEYMVQVARLGDGKLNRETFYDQIEKALRKISGS